MRSKIPHYNVGDPLIDALAYRLQYSLMALDEIGIQHYRGVDDDSLDNTLYHFNYLISLITGIFDNLALKTNTDLKINFKDLRKVSLSGRSGKEFLRAIRDENNDIRSYINSYVSYINLIYYFRELVIHREGLVKLSAEINDIDISWKVNLIKISDDIDQCLKQCKDRNSKYDPFTEWGFCQLGKEKYIVPFLFSKSALSMIIKFVDGYLKLLDYPSFIEEQKKKNTSFYNKISLFEKGSLGF